MADAVVVGADRVAANGDVANKIGTYSLALAARRAGIPFVVAVPGVDVRRGDRQRGDRLPLELRADEEVTHVLGVPAAPAGTRALNYAFDVTPADLVTAIVTESQADLPRRTPRLSRLTQAPGRVPVLPCGAVSMLAEQGVLTAMTDTMMALRAHARGGPEQLVYEAAPVPVPGPGEALVAVHAAAITFAELSWDESWTTRDGRDRTPVIPSHEVSGTVAALGPGADGVTVGEEVYGLIDFDRDGAAAEYVDGARRAPGGQAAVGLARGGGYLAAGGPDRVAGARRPRGTSNRGSGSWCRAAPAAWAATPCSSPPSSAAPSPRPAAPGSETSSSASAPATFLAPGAGNTAGYKAVAPDGFDVVIDTIGGAVLDASYGLTAPGRPAGDAQRPAVGGQGGGARRARHVLRRHPGRRGAGEARRARRRGQAAPGGQPGLPAARRQAGLRVRDQAAPAGQNGPDGPLTPIFVSLSAPGIGQIGREGPKVIRRRKVIRSCGAIRPETGLS